MTFREKVYEVTGRIPEGRVATYGQIADIIGCPGAARAVGNALHANPFAPRDRYWLENAKDRNAQSGAPAQEMGRVVPCHRVVAADGGLAANFGCGGPAVQYERLKAEGVVFVGNAENTDLLRPKVETDPQNQRNSRCASSESRSIGGRGEYPKVDLQRCGIVIERHPLEAFAPANGRMLFLGSFPPPKARWSMEFFYPNWINDFWRIQGLIHYKDDHWFEEKAPAGAAGPKAAAAPRRFDKQRIVEFCLQEGLAFYDTAAKVCRWRGNASDEFLEILEPADIAVLLSQMPACRTVITTGGKSAGELQRILQHPGPIPPVGSYIDLQLGDRAIRWWRMPSSSRAYPMSLADKAAQYSKLFRL